jgi:hypothetical protein
MEAFLQLEKGDIDNLEGKVIVYSKLLSDTPISDEDFLGVYASSNPVDFKEKFGESVEEEISKHINKIKSEFLEEEISDKNIFLAAPIPISPTDLKLASEDVVYVGEFPEVEQCQMVIMSSVQIYMANYDRQRLLKGGFSGVNESKSSESLDKGLENLETYFDIEPERKSGYIQEHYISPVMHAIENNDMPEAKTIAKDFVRFSTKSPLIDDAYGIAAVLNAKEFIKEDRLLQFYFEKILAIVSERFREAAKIRDKINTIKQGK